MKKDWEALLRELREIHEDFREIAAAELEVAEWVRWKCKFGCRAYAKHLTCPPYAPTPEETRRLLAGYERAVVARFEEVQPNSEVPPAHIHHYLWDAILKMHETMFELERHTFLAGYYKAFAMAALPCSYCSDCLPERAGFVLEGEASKRFCERQERARPSMEACGIDVFTTVQKVGYELEVRRSATEEIIFFGLLLIE